MGEEGRKKKLENSISYNRCQEMNISQKPDQHNFALYIHIAGMKEKKYGGRRVAPSIHSGKTTNRCCQRARKTTNE